MTKRERSGLACRTTALGAGMLLALACTSATEPTPIFGSESHFLRYCDRSCEDGFDCIEGVCTRSCALDTGCSDLGASVECVHTGDDPEQSAACDVRCDTQAECAPFGPVYQCSAGFCRNTSDFATNAALRRCSSERPGELLTVQTQPEVDALEGCKAIYGHLDIQKFEGADLRPLRELVTIHGMLRIGDPYAEFAEPAFPTLEGLESVRELIAMDLRALRVTSLLSLRGLRRFLPSTQRYPESGLVIISSCPELIDLHGLEQLAGLDELLLQENPKLGSLEGLQIPSQIRRILVADSPLTSLAGLETLTSAGSLAFDGTSITNLAGLERLERADGVSFYNNSNLTDLSAIASVVVGGFGLMGNESLQVVPELPNAARLTGFYLAENPVLEVVPVWPALRHVDALQIYNNPRLASVPALSTVESVDHLDIDNNAGLVELDLRALRDVSGRLRIAHNASLAADAIFVSPNMSSAVTTIGGNAGSTPLLDPCPWSNDGYCDGPPFDDLCAATADRDCPSPRNPTGTYPARNSDQE